MRYEVWYRHPWGWVHETDMTYRWRWLARLVAWEHARRGWFDYEVRP